MGKASSSKKVARAKRAAGRPGAKKSFLWPVAIGAVVVLGVLLVVVSAGGREAPGPPLLGDHWHAAYGVYDCNDFVAPFNDVKPDESGIHSHGDGLIHIHPFSTRYTGDDANLEAFGDTVGMELTDERIEGRGISRENGDDCGGEEGVVQVWVWDNVLDEEGSRIESDLASYAPPDGSLVTIAFAPEGAEIPKPPAAAQASLQAPADVVGPQNTVPPPGEEPEGTDTTVPVDEPEGTDTTEPAETETTETTAAP